MISSDVPPFCLGIGYPFKLSGLNWIGLKRKGVSHEIRKGMIKAYRITLLSGLSWGAARKQIMSTLDMNQYIQKWIDFCEQSVKGLAPPRVRGKARKKDSGGKEYPELVEMR